MGAVPRNNISFEQLSDAGCGSRIAFNSIIGLGVGVAASVAALALKGQGAGKATGALRSLMYEIVPLTTVSGAVYSAGSCLTADARGSHDWVSNAVGGATAGAVIAGVKKQSLQGAFVGALAFGTAAAAVQWWSAMSPSVSEVEKRAPSPAALVHAPTPAALATSSRSSASLVSRLQ